MSALAIAFHKKGWKVTGSDKGFYPPVSTHLKNAGVAYYPGWHVEKMTANGDPDLVVVGNVAGSTNPEWVYVQENQLNYKSYPEVIAEYFVKENSIVCAGTYGKTTTSTLLTWIFQESEKDPSYMFGGISLNGIDAAKITDLNTSILEGDEYKASKWDNGPKFALYSPNHLLLSSVVWDHADIYKTENIYFDAFKKLVKSIPETGTIVVCTDQGKAYEIVSKFSGTRITYGKAENADYQYFDFEQSQTGINFKIKHDDQVFEINSPVLGNYMAENICGAFAMAHSFGIETEKIIKAIASFKGLKRRLEKRHDSSVVVIDDIAHSPAKANSVLKNLRQIYKGKIYAVFEPNTGNRQQESEPSYENAFVDADEVIIPRLTRIKIDPNQANKPYDGPELAKLISNSHKQVANIVDDNELVDYLVKITKKDDCIVFLGSHGFRGMIEELVKKFE